jgi:peroxiredoxin
MRALLVLFVCAAALSASGELSGRRAPGFSLPDLYFKQHDPQDYRGKLLLIDIIQTTCPHCATFAETLEKVKKTYGEKVAVLSIVISTQENQNTVAAFVKGHGITYPVLFDCGQVTASYVKATPQNPTVSFPHLFIIDQQGTIRNDYTYDLLTRDVFEGKALFAEIDRMIGGAGRGKK